MPAAPRAPISRWYARTNVHATESRPVVEGALRQLLGDPSVEISGVQTEGHHGNPIITLSATRVGAADGRVLLQRLASLGVLTQVWATLDDRVDESGKIFLRFDKQAAAQGRFELGFRGDDIQVVIQLTSYPARRSTAIAALDAYLKQARWATPPP